MIEIEFDKVVHSSDHFERIQEFTEQLIRSGDAFMDDTDGETVCVMYLKAIHSNPADSVILGQGATSSRDSLEEPRCIDRR
jgi:glutamyl/glutaminyl-tRNA synthetase